MIVENKKENRKSQIKIDIYRSIRADILKGGILPGTPLKQDALAKDYGVSKIPIRETLKRLEADGLVEFKGRRGAFAIQHSMEDILEIQDIRIALECRALELAIPRMTDADIIMADEILIRYENANNIEEWSEMNRQFHDCLYAPCGLPKMMAMIRKIVEQTGLFIRLEVTIASGFERPHVEHRAILEACKNGETALAVKLLKKHIEQTKKEVMAHFRRKSLSLLN